MKRFIVCPLALLLTGCGSEEVEEESQPAYTAVPRQIVIQPTQPPQMPAIPVVPAAPPKPPPTMGLPTMGQPTMGMRTMPTQPTFSAQSMMPKHPDPKQVQMDLLAKYQAVYADYAAGVTKLERETAHISAKDYTHRQRFYWLPLNKFSEQLQSQYQINGYQLAQIVNQGLEEGWPTQSTQDSASVTRMFRRIGTEQMLAARHAEASANMACLDALVDSIIAAGTAAGTAGNQGPVAIGGGVRAGGIMPPIFTGPGGWRSYMRGDVRLGSPIIGR